MTFDRSFYIPKNATEIKDEQSDGVCYTYNVWNMKSEKMHHLALAFHGKAQKPDFHYRYSSEEARNTAVHDFFDGRRETLAAKASYRKSRQAETRELEVGDVLSASWGYDQTNVDYYQVTKLIGKTMVEIRQIAAAREETGFMSGRCEPQKDQFIGKPIRKAAKKGTVKVFDWGVWASKITPNENGKFSSQYYSCYA